MNERQVGPTWRRRIVGRFFGGGLKVVRRTSVKVSHASRRREAWREARREGGVVRWRRVVAVRSDASSHPTASRFAPARSGPALPDSSASRSCLGHNTEPRCTEKRL